MISKRTLTGYCTDKRTYIFLLGIMFLSTVFAYFLPEIAIKAMRLFALDYLQTELADITKMGEKVILVLSVLVCLGCSLPLFTIYILFVHVFRREQTGVSKLVLVLATYFYMIIGFADTYFVLTYFADGYEAHHKYLNYRSIAQELPVQIKEDMIKNDIKIIDNYAFRGIEKKMWSGLETKAIPPVVQAYNSDTARKNVSAANLFSVVESFPEWQIVNYIPENKSEIYSDCLYLSTVTIASLGYGDITPTWKITKFLVALEVVLGQLLLALGVASAFAEMPLK